MNLKIHRGTKEIGGSCVELWTDNSRILIDFGMPLVENNGSEFNFKKYSDLSTHQLIQKGILPDVQGIYKDATDLIDGVLISHPHQDHYGFGSYLHNNLNCYMGEATLKLIELTSLFTPSNVTFNNVNYFEKNKPFLIGDFTITPYWADHSAFDSYAFLIQANGKTIFYSGDFRGHGRKHKVFKWFTHNAPANIDYLLLEGTMIGRSSKLEETETHIEEQLTQLFKEDKINLVYTSGQNIDRQVSIYRACVKAGKTLVVDIYVAHVLDQISAFANIHHPANDFGNIKVIYPRYTSNKISRDGNKNLLYKFTKYKITKEEISKKPNDIVMLVRTSMQEDLELIKGIEGGNLIYSMWEGYLKKSGTIRFVDYLKKRNFLIHKIHTSGHADIPTLKHLVEAIKPKAIIPIHTFNAKDYDGIFQCPIRLLSDGETLRV